MKTKLMLFLMIATVLSLSLTAQSAGFAPAYIAAGGGYSDTSKAGFAWVASAKRTGVLNGTFPVYSYSEVRGYRFRDEAGTYRNATDFTTGFLFPFYAKTLLGFNVKLAVDGNIGLSTAPANVGYTVGAKVVAAVGRPAWKKWGFVVSADPRRSSITGVQASQISAGVTLALNGL